MTITPSQCRGARAMLGWTQGQLARTAQVVPSIVTMFELGKRDPEPHPLLRIQQTLEDAGITFIADDGDKASHQEPAGPATDAVKAMDTAIKEHRSSKRQIRKSEMGQPTEDKVFDRAKQLFEEENGRPWTTSFTKRSGDTPASSPSEHEAAKYIERARVELSAIEEEGHS